MLDDHRTPYGAGPIPMPNRRPDFGEPVPASPLLGLMDPREVWATVRRRPWTVVLVTLVVVTLVYLAIGRAPAQYAATAVIRIADARRAIAGDFVDPSLRTEGGLTDPILTQLQILRSRGIIVRMIDSPEGAFLRLRTKGVTIDDLEEVSFAPQLARASFDVRFDSAGVTLRDASGEATAPYGRPVELGGLRFTVPHAPEAAAGTIMVQDEEATVRDLLRKTSARKREGTDVVDVMYSSDDPYRAQRAVNLLVRTYVENDLESAQQRARRRRTFLEEQLAQNASLAERARDSLTNFRSRQGALNSAERFSREQAAVTASSTELDLLTAERSAYEMLLRRIEDFEGPGRAAGVRVALASARNISPVVSQLGEQLIRLDAARDSLSTGPAARAPTNPEMIALEQRILRARDALLAGVRSQLEAVRIKERQAASAVARGSGTLGRIPEQSAEEVRLVERHEVYQRISNQLREEYQRAQVAEAVVGGDVQIIDEAGFPAAPTGLPPALRAILFGLCLGLFGGTTVAYGSEVLNTSIRRRDDVEAMLGIPGLAIIPSVNKKGLFGAIRARAAAKERGESRLVRRDPDPAKAWLPEEAFRMLRTNLLYARAPGSIRMLVITSARASEGKTTIAANLGICLARQGLRVLLVDCDLRRPRLHATFRLSREPGLTSVIGGATPAAAAVQATAFQNLFLLPAGPYIENQVELLGGPAMQKIFRTLARDYDMMIVDTPPVLITADAAIVAAVGDAVLLVVHAGRTTRDEGKRALQQLRRVDAHVLGAVLNDREERSIGAETYYADVAAYAKTGRYTN